MSFASRVNDALAAAWAQRNQNVPVTWPPLVPEFILNNAKFWPLLEGGRELWQTGEPILARVLQANNAIFEPGEFALLGEVIWGEDPYVRRDSDLLAECTERYWALRRKPSSAPGLRSLSAFVADDKRPVGRTRFPPLLSAGRVIEHATVLFHREHLVTGVLASDLVPILRDPTGNVPLVLVPPIVFWPAELIARWRSAKQDRTS